MTPLDLYYWPTPNGHKITMLLEEAGLPYVIKPVDIGKGDQFKPDFLKISPNNKMPAIVDHAPDGDGPTLALFESGAILLYLSEKIGRFRGEGARGKAEVLQWLFWQVGGLGPMAGQNHHFSVYAPEKHPYAINRYVTETSRLYRVLDERLADRPFVTGAAYTIADMAIYPWIVPWKAQSQDLAARPNLKRWFDAVAARPATVAAYAKGQAVHSSEAPMSDEAKKILFGQK